jgi:hypothetical protein
MQYFQARSYVPRAANRMHVRSRPAAFCAKHFLKLAMLRQSFMLPQTIFCQVNFTLKNATIQSIRGGDDDIYSVYNMNRDQLQTMYDALRAPHFLNLAGEHAGTFPTELGFLAWLHLNGQGCKLQDLQKEFGMEYSRLNRGLRAFETWMFEEHSFRCAEIILHFCLFINYCAFTGLLMRGIIGPIM